MENRTNFIRVEKDRNYSVIHNQFLRRNDLSWKAKGILAYILMLPDDWNINLKEVLKHATEGERAFRSGWKELENTGYVQRQPVRKGNRIDYWETVVREKVDMKANPELCGFEHVENVDVENVDVQNEDVQNDELLSTYSTKNLSELSTDSTKDIMSSSDEPDRASETIPYKEIIDHLNQKTNSKYKHSTNKTQSLIKARWNEGFRVDEFKQVIDNKTDEWLNTDMSKYLRPNTLFAGKFDDYLNQQAEPKLEQDGWMSEYDDLF